MCSCIGQIAMHMQVGNQDLFIELIDAALKAKILETITSEYSQCLIF